MSKTKRYKCCKHDVELTTSEEHTYVLTTETLEDAMALESLYFNSVKYPMRFWDVSWGKSDVAGKFEVTMMDRRHWGV